MSWLRAVFVESKPWHYRWRVLYRHARDGSRHPSTGKVYAEPQGRLRSVWTALSFPHTHTDEELGERVYRTSTGRVLTDADIEALADEAETGYDVEELKKRGPRPT